MRDATTDGLTAAEANRLLYAHIADTYDASEECITDARLRERLASALARARGELPDDRPLDVLDACGGSGNASLLLFEFGLQPVTVDISREMLALFARKATAKGYRPDCITAKVEDFLARDPRQWDMITFSSALHHLENVEEVVERALDRLRPGGVLVTMFDPTCVTAVGQRLRRLDYMLHVVLRTPGRLPSLVGARLFAGRTRAGSLRDTGVLAERHALTGIDDIALAERLRARGATVLEHGRYFEGRFALTRALFSALRIPSSFHLMVRVGAVAEPRKRRTEDRDHS